MINERLRLWHSQDVTISGHVSEVKVRNIIFGEVQGLLAVRSLIVLGRAAGSSAARE